MGYESQICFTLDTVCPWTYLAKNRQEHSNTTGQRPLLMPSYCAAGLIKASKGHDHALDQFRSSPSSKDVSFTIKYLPYQLYPEMSKEGVDKYEWYKRTKWDNSEERMQKFVTLMSTYGKGAGIDFDFHGTVANTLDAHRFILHYQEELGPEVADNIIHSLYTQYFTQRAHPSAPATLLKAGSDVGIDEAKAKPFVDDEYEGLQETKMLIKEQASNGVDSVSTPSIAVRTYPFQALKKLGGVTGSQVSDTLRLQVPYVTIEGKRRDFTLVGAKETGEYLKALESVAKEAA
ncbi:MAG: hypothetical protein Q9218_000481 [Villophora microphyllina]